MKIAEARLGCAFQKLSCFYRERGARMVDWRRHHEDRDLIRERQREGMALAKLSEGTYKGRKPSLAPAQAREFRRWVAAVGSKTPLARELGVARMAICHYAEGRAIKKAQGLCTAKLTLVGDRAISFTERSARQFLTRSFEKPNNSGGITTRQWDREPQNRMALKWSSTAQPHGKRSRYTAELSFLEQVQASMSVISRPPPASSILRRLGPGLITGAADDDPSGIATYSQVGAEFGYGLAWTMLFSLPFMIAIQEISGRIGCVSGRGIAANLRDHYPPWLGRSIVCLLLVANVINLGADIGAMGSALQLLIGGNPRLYAVSLGILCVLAEVFISYERYAGILKWLTVSLFSYVAVVLSLHLPWARALEATFIPHVALDSASAMALVAVLGTTISPYLFFWQSSLEVQERLQRRGVALRLTSSEAPASFKRIRTDTVAGMCVSNLIAIFIIYATSATLHASGITLIQTSSQAAEALRPIAGRFAFVIFAAGIIGTGLLAVPVLAGSGAYALADCFSWQEGLDQQLFRAKAFYAAIAVATMAGVGLNFTAFDPVRALYWSAVVNGLLATPVMTAVMLLASNPQVMGQFTLKPGLRTIGWLATVIMLGASIGFFLLAGRG